MVEQVDTQHLKCYGHCGRAGSIPAPGTMKTEIDKDYFIKVCNESESMSKACTKLQLHFNTFKRLAIKYGCYKPNQSGKGIHKKSNGNDIPLNEILEGKHPQYQTFKLKNKLFANHIK